MKPIISVEGLGKSYTIRHEGQTRYKSLREEIFKLPKRLLQRNSQNQEEFWALKDVSFDVMPGDRLGIIGRNGSGKSTLLKLLSRITEPTTGRITLRGRVASLLEVGTGFHPELTGRENIFLNGAILGMSRAEVRRKFDEIVDFAGVEKFLDTPVKRYSSGMYVRLAFAVAAHLEPEILIVDEVLAVGDAEFQKKCLGKMEEVGKEGRTILFVSHNIGMIIRLCNKGVLLKNGVTAFIGESHQAISKYNSISMGDASFLNNATNLPENAFLSACMIDKSGQRKTEYSHEQALYLLVTLLLRKITPEMRVDFSLYDFKKNRIFTISESLNGFTLDNQQVTLRIALPENFVLPGDYSWLMGISVPHYEAYDLQDDICHFSIIDGGSDFAQYAPGSYGAVKIPYHIEQV